MPKKNADLSQTQNINSQSDRNNNILELFRERLKAYENVFGDPELRKNVRKFLKDTLETNTDINELTKDFRAKLRADMPDIEDDKVKTASNILKTILREQNLLASADLNNQAQVQNISRTSMTKFLNNSIRGVFLTKEEFAFDTKPDTNRFRLNLGPHIQSQSMSSNEAEAFAERVANVFSKKGITTKATFKNDGWRVDIDRGGLHNKLTEDNSLHDDAFIQSINRALLRSQPQQQSKSQQQSTPSNTQAKSNKIFTDDGIVLKRLIETQNNVKKFIEIGNELLGLQKQFDELNRKSKSKTSITPSNKTYLALFKQIQEKADQLAPISKQISLYNSPLDAQGQKIYLNHPQIQAINNKYGIVESNFSGTLDFKNLQASINNFEKGLTKANLDDVKTAIWDTFGTLNLNATLDPEKADKLDNVVGESIDKLQSTLNNNTSPNDDKEEEPEEEEVQHFRPR